MIGTKDNEPNFKKLYYKSMKETKVSYDYIYEYLESIEECYDIEKITTQVLKAMIEKLVKNQE